MSAKFFVKSLALIYFISFISLSFQILGLLGSHGILPIKDLFNNTTLNYAGSRYWQVPTIFWFNHSDLFLLSVCYAGAFVSVLLFMGSVPWLSALVLWLLYLSITNVGQDFLGFQWDNLLLETGFITIFLFSPRLTWRWRDEHVPSKIVVWIFRVLLFKVMFESGIVKILSQDVNWRNLTALTYHYMTQPLPNFFSWYFYQLPVWFHKICCVVLLVIEIMVPFLIFCGRQARLIAFFAFCYLQCIIIVTGNYGFFNLLTLALCFTLLDDQQLGDVLPFLTIPKPYRIVGTPLWHTALTSVLLGFFVILSAIPMIRAPYPAFVYKVYRDVAPFRTINSYGLFAVMTTYRDEIVIEGSMDGINWQEYEFKYKPGDLKQIPCWVMPHQPRLDWQMWFAALGDYRFNTWVLQMMQRLLEDEDAVTHLFKVNPFAHKPPKYIRALVYEYRFTDSVNKSRTGQWWQRRFKGLYTPVMGLNKHNAIVFFK